MRVPSEANASEMSVVRAERTTPWWLWCEQEEGRVRDEIRDVLTHALRGEVLGLLRVDASTKMPERLGFSGRYSA